jgi:uncharacterized protein YhbP (UPF0306 family)
MCLILGALLFVHEPATSKGSTFPTFVPAATVKNEIFFELLHAKVKDNNGFSRTISSYLETDMSAGYWYSSQEGNEYCIEFKGNRGHSNWNMSRCFNRELFQKKENNVFVMTKETGTLQLTGNLDAEVGQGKYTFTEDASFKKFLADNNISSNEKNLLFHLFFGDVNKEYVQFLKKQYREVSGERLLELAIHGVSFKNYQGFLTLFKKHSNVIPSIKDVVAARIHGLNEEYVQELQRLGYTELSLKKMMEAKIHGVNATYVETLSKAGFGKLPIDKIIAAKIHGVQPATVKEMQSLGLGELSLDKVIELQIHGVSANYMSDLKSVGFEDLTFNQVLEAKIHGLNPVSIKEMKALGYKDVTLQGFTNAKIHGVDVAYVEDLKKAGFQNLTMDKTVEAKIHGVNSSFIKKAREQGYNLPSIDKYISLKIHGLAMESMQD